MFGSTDESINVVVEHFRAHSEVRVDDSLNTFLGSSVKDRGGCVKLHNAPMAQRLLEPFKIDQCKP